MTIRMKCDRCDEEVDRVVRLTPSYVWLTPQPGSTLPTKDLCFDCYNGYAKYCEEDRTRRRAEQPVFDRT